MQSFMVNGQYNQLLQQNGFDVGKVLRLAQLPENLFMHDQIQISEAQYYSLMNAIERLAPDAEHLIALSTYAGIETFSAPILAAYCSENGLKCINRLKQYKQLIGPVLYEITQANDKITVTLQSINHSEIKSRFYVASEFVFLIKLLSKASEQEIQPTEIVTAVGEFADEFVAQLGIKPDIGTSNSITFKRSDLEYPFLTDNQAMRRYLEPELQRRLSEFEVDESYSAQVRSLLVDLLPAGETTIEVAASKLNISKRTLQRKLTQEDTNFQQQLNNVREMLAKNYLKNTTLSVDEIAYLLGYLESNSFLRAFLIWTGTSVSHYRRRNTNAK